jgi:hypothetical protein
VQLRQLGADPEAEKVGALLPAVTPHRHAGQPAPSRG